MITDSLNILIVRDRAGSRIYSLDQPRYRVGRSSSSDIKIFSHLVSRSHASLFRIFDIKGHLSYRLVDGDVKKGQASKNGTFVNGKRVSSQLLKNHDRIQLGSQVVARFFHFDRNSNSEPDLHLAQKLQKALRTQLPPSPPEISFETVILERQIPDASPSGSDILGSGTLNSGTLNSGTLDSGTTGDLSLETQLVSVGVGDDRARDRGQTVGEVTLGKEKTKLGELLLTRQLITLGQLKYALFQQRFKGSKLGEILIEEGMIEPEVLKRILKEK